MSFFPYAVAVWLFLIGLYGMVTSRNLIHLVICLVVTQSSTDVLLLTIGYHSGAGAPVFASVPMGTPAVDPIVQALTLTDVVVGAAVTTLLLSIAVQTHKKCGTLDPEDRGCIRCTDSRVASDEWRGDSPSPASGRGGGGEGRVPK